jgi:hypothetical protein
LHILALAQRLVRAPGFDRTCGFRAASSKGGNGGQERSNDVQATFVAAEAA